MTAPQTTPQTWPEGTWPTVDEWLPWYDEQTADVRHDLAVRLIDAVQTAHRCHTLDHDHAVEQLGRNARRIVELEAENRRLESERNDAILAFEVLEGQHRLDESRARGGLE